MSKKLPSHVSLDDTVRVYANANAKLHQDDAVHILDSSASRGSATVKDVRFGLRNRKFGLHLSITYSCGGNAEAFYNKMEDIQGLMTDLNVTSISQLVDKDVIAFVRGRDNQLLGLSAPPTDYQSII
jgi:hypothetical protein